MQEEFKLYGHIFTREELEEWGREYLQGGADEIFEMSMLDEVFRYDTPSQIVNAVCFGSDFSPYGDTGYFTLDAEYFTLDGYGNLMSIDKHYLADRIRLCLDVDFINFCQDRDYIPLDNEAEEEAEEEEPDRELYDDGCPWSRR